jgi:glutathione S-transferase
MEEQARPIVYHIPACPFSQRVEILLELKGLREAADFRVIDITQPRPWWLLRLTRGSTRLPVLHTRDGRIIKESLVILRYLEEIFPERRVARSDPYERAVETMLVAQEGGFAAAGYRLIMNRDQRLRPQLVEEMQRHYANLDDFLMEHNPAGTFLFDDFGWAEMVFTPLFMRFWFLEYYEGFDLPGDRRYSRVRGWRDACLAHRAARQVSREEIIKLYYDYALGAGNGALLPGRRRSSFAFTPGWAERPWPPRDKYRHQATDQELGLLSPPRSDPTGGRPPPQPKHTAISRSW